MKVIATRRHDYTILKELEAGLILKGTEIKAVVDNRINLAGSYVIIANNEAWAHQIKIDAPKTPYFTPEVGRAIKLLLNKKEILSLKDSIVIPVSIYLVRNKAKIKIAVVKKATKGDKRQRELKKEHRLEIKEYV